MLSTLSQQRAHVPITVAAGLAPDAGDLGLAARTFTVITHPTCLHHEPVPLDHRRVALMTARVLPLANLPRYIAGIHVLQSSALPVLDDLHQVIDGRSSVPLC